MKKAFFNWSTGKDSALALYKILQDKNYSIDKLVTSVNENFSRVLMHGVQEDVIEWTHLVARGAKVFQRIDLAAERRFA